MSAPEIGIKDLLVSSGVGTFAASSGWGIFIGRLPTSPDTAIACIKAGGRSPFPHLLLNFPSVQVMIRGSSGGYEAAEAKARAVVDALLGIPSQTINNDDWGGITQLGDVISLGFDEKDRPIFSCNFSIIMEPSAGGYRQSI